jgi:drug/metabolite transporter (DMT)-like permease
MKTASVLTLAILAQAAGNIFLSKGMRQLASVGPLTDDNWLNLLIGVVENPTIWLGTALLLVFFFLFAAALSWADLSFVLPASAFGYVINVGFARYFLNEPVTSARWAGTLLISIGVILVSRSGHRGTELHRQGDVMLVGERE